MARPETLEALQALVSESAVAGRTLEFRGGGSRAAVGRPEPADQIADLSAFSGVVDYDPAELVLTAGAATPLVEIEAAVAARGQMLAFEPMDYGPLLGGASGRATLGGVIAANGSGPRRLTAGSARDHFLGFEAVSGRGEAFKGGGKVVKNVTGYDLPKLMSGSWGTLAALTQVTVKVLPRPRAETSLVFSGLSDREACVAMAKALGSTAPVTAAACLPERGWTVLRLEGVEPGLDAGADGLKVLLGPAERLDAAASRALWTEIREVRPFAGDDRPIWRVSVPPADGWRLAEALQDLDARWLYDWGGGLVWLSVSPADDAHAERVRAAASWLGGHAALIRAPEAVRAAVPTFQPESPALAALSARVRQAFDPKGVLGPRHRIGG